MNPRFLSIQVQAVPADAAAIDALAARCLDPREVALISPRSTPKRRAEFIAGRVAARAAVSHLIGLSPSSSSFLILREGTGPTGRPTVVLPPGHSALNVSISHAERLAIAAASSGRVGLDLVSVQTQERSFLEDAFSPLELTRWAAWLRSETTSALAISTAFAAKEAALKWLGTGFALPLRAIEILPAGIGSEEHPAPFPAPTLAFPVSLIERDSGESRSLTGRFACIDGLISILLTD
jgi:phosphopantetheinyl transferase